MSLPGIQHSTGGKCVVIYEKKLTDRGKKRHMNLQDLFSITFGKNYQIGKYDVEKRLKMCCKILKNCIFLYTINISEDKLSF